MSISSHHIAKTNSPRSPIRPFGLRLSDRLLHTYIIGQTGTGKSTLLEHLIVRDMASGQGLAVIDPHGDLADQFSRLVPKERRCELISFNPIDTSQPFGLNPVAKVPDQLIPLAVSGLIESFKKHWGSQAWGNRMEHILRCALFALIEAGGAHLPDVQRILTESPFRAKVLARVKNETVRQFWLTEFPSYNPRYRAESIAPIQNKLGNLLADPRLYRLFTHPEPLRFRRIMDERKILIINLSKGNLGEDTSSILGSMIVSTLGLAAMSRASLMPEMRLPFFIHCDEFQCFLTESFAGMISELRKYGIGLTLCHQHSAQLDPKIRSAVLGNVGTVIAFRLGVEDAPILAKEFHPYFDWQDLTKRPNYDFLIKMLIDGTPARPFSATSYPPLTLPYSTPQ
jgi:Type IV secretion-system coupling protein DNA-binding domain